MKVFPSKFEVFASDFSRKRFRVFLGNDELPNKDTLLVPPKKEFSVFFYTGDKKFAVYGRNLFESASVLCGLDTMNISFH